MGPVKLSEIEQAQQEIVDTAPAPPGNALSTRFAVSQQFIGFIFYESLYISRRFDARVDVDNRNIHHEETRSRLLPRRFSHDHAPRNRRPFRLSSKSLPGSTDRALQETMDAASDISDHVDAFTCSSFQLFENTPFYRRADAFGLLPEGREELFSVRGIRVHSFRRAYVVRGEDGGRALPRAAAEAAKWKQWQLIVRGGDTFFESLPAEHYLLIAAHRRDEHSTHRTPTRPATPRPLRRAG